MRGYVIFQKKKKKKNHKKWGKWNLKLVFISKLILLYMAFLSFLLGFSSFYNTINVSVKKENPILSHKETLQLVWFLLLVYGPYLKHGLTAEKRGAVSYPAL